MELDVCFTSPGHEDRLTMDDFRTCIDGKSTGAVRISVGMVTNFKDVQAFLAFARGSVDPERFKCKSYTSSLDSPFIMRIIAVLDVKNE